MHGHHLIEHFRPAIATLIGGRHSLTMVEAGSERGSGSTRLLAELAKSLKLKFITVDADAEVAQEAKNIVASIDPGFEAHHGLAEEFLEAYERADIAVLYMDAFDIVDDWPHKQTTIDSYARRNVELSNENAWQMHYDASRAVFEKVIPGGFLCFDDVWKDVNGSWRGKGKTAIPFLLHHGYDEIWYQPARCVMLRRSNKASRSVDASVPTSQLLSTDVADCHRPRFLFVPSNEAHARLMHAIHSQLQDSAFMVFETRSENADSELHKLGATVHTYGPGLLGELEPLVVVLGNDWGAEERQIISEARELGVPTVCIQEGCLDFADDRMLRMRHADYAFLQGPEMLRYLDRPNAIVTGNPKYDSVRERPFDPELPIMINCNFTYGVYEEAREPWIREAIGACREAGRDFFISQHPRDRAEFPNEYTVIRSDASKIQDQLEQTSLVITRFSTVIYEALMMGRKVIYFNPHGEPFRIFQQDETGAVPVARNQSELLALLRLALTTRDDDRIKRRQFLLSHCATLDGDAAERCADEVRAIAERHQGGVPSTQAGNGVQHQPQERSLHRVGDELLDCSKAELIQRAKVHLQSGRIADAADCIRVGRERYPNSAGFEAAWNQFQSAFGGQIPED